MADFDGGSFTAGAFYTVKLFTVFTETAFSLLFYIAIVCSTQ